MLQLDVEPLSMEQLAKLTRSQRLERRAKLDALADLLDDLSDIHPRYWVVMRELVKLQWRKWPENA